MAISLKNRIGLIVNQKITDYSKLPLELRRFLGPRSKYQENWNFSFRLGRFSDCQPGEKFVTHPFFEELSRQHVPLGALLGHSELNIFKDKRLIQWKSFFPFQSLEEKFPIAVRHRGIGALLHSVIFNRVYREFPGFRVRHQGKRSAEETLAARIEQIERFGLKPKQAFSAKGYSAAEYHRRMTRYLRGMYKRFPVVHRKP